jgi:hypothetical protein
MSQNDFMDFSDFYFTNPAHNYISIQSTSDIDKVEMYSLIGAKVISQTTNTNEIEVSNLSKGVYLMVVYSGNKKGSKKVIIN